MDTSFLMLQARKGKLIQLHEDLLNQLENTDANTFEAGDWKAVHLHSNPGSVLKEIGMLDR
jgi:hypothetical protein